MSGKMEKYSSVSRKVVVVAVEKRYAYFLKFIGNSYIRSEILVFQSAIEEHLSSKKCSTSLEFLYDVLFEWVNASCTVHANGI